MELFRFLLAMVFGLFAAVTNPATTTPNVAMSKDWAPAFAQGFSPASMIEPGAQMVSIQFANLPNGLDKQFRGQVRNQCPFSIWVRQTVAANSSSTGLGCEFAGDTPDVEVKPGHIYKAPNPCKMDQCGHNLKIKRDLGDGRVYQIEYSGDAHDGRIWFKLSVEDGSPFQDVERYLGAFGPTCPFGHCAPGQWGKDPVHGCDWPSQPYCDTVGSFVAVLCGRL